MQSQSNRQAGSLLSNGLQDEIHPTETGKELDNIV